MAIVTHLCYVLLIFAIFANLCPLDLPVVVVVVVLEYVVVVVVDVVAVVVVVVVMVPLSIGQFESQ